MALCCAHTAAGYLAYEAVRPAGPHRLGLLAAAVLLANAPDLDFLPGFVVGSPGAYHRGVTHTVAAAVAVGALVWVAGRLRGWPARVGLWAGAVYGSHLVLDFFTIDARAPHGARFLWPMSERYFLSPVTVLREILIDPSGREAFLRSLAAPPTWGVWAGEVSLLVFVVAAVHVARGGRAVLGVRVRGVPEGP
jgi:membrane-bound metal-dependent hydrolase YbcI (DUF457 family)